MRIGIDVGGTNTDAVAVEEGRVLRSVKTPTTRDVEDGIRKALKELLAGLDPSRVTAVVLGTTHFANAVIERRRLTKTAAVRLCLPAGASLPPMCDWPPDLREAVSAGTYMTPGGLEFDGRPIASLDERHLRRIGAELREKGVEAVAVSAVFSPLDATMEREAVAILRSELPDAIITPATEIGRMGLLERENAAIINAALVPLARRIVAGFKKALADIGLTAPFHLTQNDGTLILADRAAEMPVVTFSSGPTNSMRGAAFLTGEEDAVVVDIGGTTSDVGVLVRGFPRPAAATVHVGGVRTNFRMPDVYSIGLGGGSIVRWGGRGAGSQARIGPDSVGYELVDRAIVFGGDVWTATDLACAAGYADVGEPARVARLLLDGAEGAEGGQDGSVGDGGGSGGGGDASGQDGAAPRRVGRTELEEAVERMHAMLEEAIDRMKTSAAPVPAVVVGGGSILVRRTLAGTSRTVKPEHFAVANAIGAAIAQVGGEIDRVVTYAGRRAEELERLRAEAVEQAVAAGADPATVEIVDVEEVPLAYLPGDSARVRIKAVGDLAAGRGRSE